jgi:hypothetical protein
MNEQISLAYSKSEISTSAVITVSQEDGSQISLPISSVTGSEVETELFAKLNAAISSYRIVKGF